jgi:hypothetical protein
VTGVLYAFVVACLISMVGGPILLAVLDSRRARELTARLADLGPRRNIYRRTVERDVPEPDDIDR